MAAGVARAGVDGSDEDGFAGGGDAVDPEAFLGHGLEEVPERHALVAHRVGLSGGGGSLFFFLTQGKFGLESFGTGWAIRWSRERV